MPQVVRHARAFMIRLAGLATLAAILVCALPMRALADEYDEQKNRTAKGVVYFHQPQRDGALSGLLSELLVPALILGVLLLIYFAILRPRWVKRQREAKRLAAQERAVALGGVFGEQGQRGGE